MPHKKTLLSRREGGVLHLTLNRPEARNAMSLAMVDELLAALAAAEADGGVRLLLLRGAGGHFCAGGDLKDMAGARGKTLSGGDAQALAKMNARFGHLCAAFAQTPLAVVAVVEGVVMGGGFGLACVADVVLAGGTLSFRLPESTLGLVPAQVAPYLVERLGYSQARRLAVTAATVDAREALAIGLVHEWHAEPDALAAAIARVVKDTLACAPGALAATKALLRNARRAPPETLIDAAAAAFSQAAQSAEGKEGLTAFMHKRPPNWVPQ